jgi:transposase
MLTEMDRNVIKFLRKKGKTYNEIAKEIGCDRKAVSKAMKEPVDKRYANRPSSSQVEGYRESIEAWLKSKLKVTRMLEKAREDPLMPYAGGKTAFYEFVAKVREAMLLGEKEIFVRFEGLPGEYLQVDWGEVRDFPFEQKGGLTRYFFAARLKFSRVMYVEFCNDMCLETLIRCMMRCFEYIGGVPWACVFDNMKTVVVGRNEKGEPIWNVSFGKFANEMEFHRELCDKGAGNQKGAVENLVMYVKGNFVSGRTFLDDDDLGRQCMHWLKKVNGAVSQAHGAIPWEVLSLEQEKFSALLVTALDYGILETCKANDESRVHLNGNIYSVPSDYARQPLIVRKTPDRIRIFDADGKECIADHPRRFGKGEKEIAPSHFEKVLEKKPKARVMLYRDYLVSQDTQLGAFISHLCRRRRGVAAFGPDILKMYELFQRHGREDFLAAVSLACEWESYGAEYLEYLLEIPLNERKGGLLSLPGIPVQEEVDRNLASYLVYVEGGQG